MPLETATTDVDEVRALWSIPGLHLPNVLTVVGFDLGAFVMSEALAEAVAGHPGFATQRTPVLAVEGMPLAYFLVAPPLPSVLLSDEARVLDAGTPLPLPPSALGETAVMWLISPEEAGNTLMAGDELADLIGGLERKSA